MSRNHIFEEITNQPEPELELDDNDQIVNENRRQEPQQQQSQNFLQNMDQKPQTNFTQSQAKYSTYHGIYTQQTNCLNITAFTQQNPQQQSNHTSFNPVQNQIYNDQEEITTSSEQIQQNSKN